MTSTSERVSTTSPSLARPGDRATPIRRSAAPCIVLWLVFRLYQIALGCTGEGNDVELYRSYAGNLRSGAAATETFQPEYPPGALTLFMLPLALGGERHYGRAFAAMIAVFDLGACLLVFHRARRRAQSGAPLSARSPLFHATAYLLITAALWPVLYARFDIVPAALVLAAVHALDRHRDRAAATILGVAAAIKLWPFALVPLWLSWDEGAQRRSVRAWLARTLTTGTGVLAGAAMAALPALPLIAFRVGSSLRYHADRGLQIESTWASAVLVLRRLGLAEVEIEEAFGSVQLAGSLPAALARLSGPATMVMAVLPAVMTFAIAIRRRRRAEPAALASPAGRAGAALENAVLATTLGVMLASKVLSPQFLLWVAPLLALTVEGWVGLMMAFLTAALTTEVYPHLYPALMGQASGQGRALCVLVARNLLLAGWYVHAIRRLAKQGAPDHRLCGEEGTLQGLVLPLRPKGRWFPGR